MNKEHTVMDQFQQQDNQLIIGGKSLSQIELLVGRTPYYAYDKQVIQHTINQLNQKLPSQIKLHYAIKANPLPAIVHFIKPLVSGFDVASKNEMLLALQTGIEPEEISFAGPGKTSDDIQASIIAGITLHVESENEIKKIIHFSKSLKIKANIAIRVNPIFELKASGMKMSGGSKPFGIDEERLPNILKHLNYETINFRGFHIFAGSQSLSHDAIIEMHNKTFELIQKLIELTPINIQYINIGGGFGIPYFPGDTRLNINAICKNLSILLEQATNLESIDLILELGRYIVGESGIYVTKITDKKISRDKTYLVCDGGLHHHLSNSGNFGQIIRKNYPVTIGNRLQASPVSNQQIVNIVGPLCTPLDILAQEVLLPMAVEGDFVVVYQSGAYGASASPKDFLSQPSVLEILL